MTINRRDFCQTAAAAALPLAVLGFPIPALARAQVAQAARPGDCGSRF